MQVFLAISLTLLLAGLGGAFVLYPVFESRRKGKGQDYLKAHEEAPAEPGGPGYALNQAREERDRIYQGLAELDRDYNAGELNPADYQELRADYKQQAVAVLVELDRLEARNRQAGDEVEQALADLLARSRQAKKTRKPAAPTAANAGAGKEEMLSLPLGLTEQPVEGLAEVVPLDRFCHRCGHRADLTAVFCSRCGQKLARIEE